MTIKNINKLYTTPLMYWLIENETQIVAKKCLNVFILNHFLKTNCKKLKY